MAFLNAFKKKSILKAAIKQTAKARSNEGPRADQLFLSAYKAFADVVEGDLILGDALYHWGLALLHEAKLKGEEEGVNLYLQAITKFNFCLLVKADYLGAAIDGGVAYMDLAQIMSANPDDDIYDLAKEFFDNAERIQKGSAAYNLACICSVRGQEEECLIALELSKQYGSLPDVDEILKDPDLERVNKTPWFTDYIERITAEPEETDENEVQYDEVGRVINKNKDKKNLSKNPESIVDGVVYGVEGNVIRVINSETNAETKVTKQVKVEPVEKVTSTQKPEEQLDVKASVEEIVINKDG